ncbi:2-amino-4-hydroxy-6-hydroxymethyldihydropteridine diphosphokinase [Luteibacter sp. 9135]|uniref:2-amino-4-hydroxy-6- hydroxymethyldihydropteridine diphosphokinase n=1 Tax=Luteibacter sp. 9135 TaxID=1500893 RepID=UPI000560B2DE|nr:2-amino-4-hydroxy-6-hydroxymethyldihydropteridine diphosphokinase [Luteibacter sp. 9135]
MSATAFIGLGGNLGDVRTRLHAAIAALDAAPGLRVTRRSRLFSTPPWGQLDQPHFINAAISVSTTLTPHALLDTLLSVEEAFGRVRQGERWGPRTLDLDLLAFGDATIADDRLTVPHPRMAERAFVLLPLADIASESVLPGLGRVSDLLEAVDASGCRALPRAVP